MADIRRRKRRRRARQDVPAAAAPAAAPAPPPAAAAPEPPPASSAGRVIGAGLVVVGVLALLSAAFKKKATAGSRVILIGDSLADGLSAPLGALARAAGASFWSDGRVSTTTAQWVSNGWLAAALASKPDVVIVSLGTNDAVKTDLAAVKRSIQAAAQMLKDSGARVLWILPPTSRLANADAVRAMISDTGVDTLYYVPDLRDDGEHPTVPGYGDLAAHAWARVAA